MRMTIADLDMRELIDAIGGALVPVIFKDVDKEVPPFTLRERSQLNAEIMGRLAAVLYCGEKVGPEVVALIELFTAHMKVEYLHSMNSFLGPDGGLSRLRNVQQHLS